MRTALQASLNVANAAARTTATAVVMHRALWLHSAGLSKELQVRIEDLPFDKVKLFTEKNNEILHTMKDSRAILCTLGIYTPAMRRKQYRFQPYPHRYQQYSHRDITILKGTSRDHKDVDKPINSRPSTSQPLLAKQQCWSLGWGSERPPSLSSAKNNNHPIWVNRYYIRQMGLIDRPFIIYHPLHIYPSYL